MGAPRGGGPRPADLLSDSPSVDPPPRAPECARRPVRWPERFRGGCPFGAPRWLREDSPGRCDPAGSDATPVRAVQGADRLVTPRLNAAAALAGHSLRLHGGAILQLLLTCATVASPADRIVRGMHECGDRTFGDSGRIDPGSHRCGDPLLDHPAGGPARHPRLPSVTRPLVRPRPIGTAAPPRA